MWSPRGPAHPSVAVAPKVLMAAFRLGGADNPAEAPFEEVRFPGAPRTIATAIDDRGRIISIYVNPNFEPDVPGARVQPADQLPELPAGLETSKETR
jgi:hypothetical protein